MSEILVHGNRAFAVVHTGTGIKDTPSALSEVENWRVHALQMEVALSIVEEYASNGEA